MEPDKSKEVNRGKKSLSDHFVKGLLDWNINENDRKMPWKGEKDPYKIWLSEVILQQTRVEQGLKYYDRFLKSFPTLQHLANTPEKEVFKLWEGLGYYSRCKNLIAAANHISHELNGVFPKDYEQILSLKGVGSYTAAAIASFAFNAPYAVLDGNVYRVLSRIFDLEVPIDTSKGKEVFVSLAQEMLPKKKSAEYNQAIMDFGATICKPLPDCDSCFFNRRCNAFLLGRQLLLPVKSQRILIKERWFNYIILRHKNKYAIHQRTGNDIWQHLFEFILIESGKKKSSKKILSDFLKKFKLPEKDYTLSKDSFQYKQRLSHQIIHFQFITVKVLNVSGLPNSILWVNLSELNEYPFPRTLQQFIQSKL